MNDTTMTVVGNLVDEPRLRVTKNGHSVANFRVASTSRRYDSEAGKWIDNATLFVTVTCWRSLAENVIGSLHKGQPVVVSGRYYMREYTVEEATRTAYELEANAVGHDLTRGIAEFRKVSRQPVVSRVELDSEGIPLDESDHYLDLADDDLAELHASADAEPALAG
ncbi:single-stranded DNA-binding protein [Jatrophihabitans sp.]|uniref:single-stranded DNA-binding protein n=1 Tax=Jatrophihabitans sp. TaxID=1932789 RepID=UPI0030C671BC|nr:hypothetical protein [Jatrophihabitans sp.]